MIIIKKEDIYTEEFKEVLAKGRAAHDLLMARAGETKVLLFLKTIEEMKAEIIKGRSLGNDN